MSRPRLRACARVCVCVRLGVHARVRVRLCVRSLAEKGATVLRWKIFTMDKNLVGRGGGGTTLGSKEEN